MTYETKQKHREILILLGIMFAYGSWFGRELAYVYSQYTYVNFMYTRSIQTSSAFVHEYEALNITINILKREMSIYSD